MSLESKNKYSNNFLTNSQGAIEYPTGYAEFSEIKHFVLQKG